MARHGAFADISPVKTASLTYIKIGAKPDAIEVTKFAVEKDDLDKAIAETFRRFVNHISALLFRDDQPMPARVFPKKGQRFKGDYEHLARTGEWTIADMVEDDE